MRARTTKTARVSSLKRDVEEWEWEERKLPARPQNVKPKTESISQDQGKCGSKWDGCALLRALSLARPNHLSTPGVTRSGDAVRRCLIYGTQQASPGIPAVLQCGILSRPAATGPRRGGCGGWDPLRFPDWQCRQGPPKLPVPEGAPPTGDRTPRPGSPRVPCSLGTYCARQIGHCAARGRGQGQGPGCARAEKWASGLPLIHPQLGCGSDLNPVPGGLLVTMSHLLACPPGRAQARSPGRRTQPALTSAPSGVVVTAEQDTWTTPTRDRAAPVGSENQPLSAEPQRDSPKLVPATPGLSRDTGYVLTPLASRTWNP